MNASDGGKNRLDMRLIGKLGLKSVLRRLGKFENGRLVPQMKNILWNWSEVMTQPTLLESTAYEKGGLLLYNTKSHPQMNAIEYVWRKGKETRETKLATKFEDRKKCFLRVVK